MPKTMAILGSALFFVLAPGTVAGLIPWWITRWEFRQPFLDLEAIRVVGILLIVAGAPGLVDSFARFALQGLGTPAPIAPTKNLVVRVSIATSAIRCTWPSLSSFWAKQSCSATGVSLCTPCWCGSASTHLWLVMRSRRSPGDSGRGTMISGPTSRDGFLD